MLPRHDAATLYWQAMVTRTVWLSFNKGWDSGRIKHAPKRGYHFVSLSPPFSPSGSGPFPLRCRKTPSFSGNSYYFHRISCMNPLFPPPGNRGQNVTRNGGPQIGACLILAEGCRFCVTVRMPIQQCGETMYWQAIANTPLSVAPLLNLPEKSLRRVSENQTCTKLLRA